MQWEHGAGASRGPWGWGQPGASQTHRSGANRCPWFWDVLEPARAQVLFGFVCRVRVCRCVFVSVRVGACQVAFRCGSCRCVSVSVRAVSIRAPSEFRVMRAGSVRVKACACCRCGPRAKHPCLTIVLDRQRPPPSHPYLNDRRKQRETTTRPPLP